MRADRTEICYGYEDGSAIAVRAGRWIDVDVHPNGSLAALIPHLYGAAVGMVLHQRGQCVLHASCVAIDGKAVGFLGDVETGKSTLAAACQIQDHAIVADDITAVTGDTVEGEPMVEPGMPVIKLGPAMARQLSNQATPSAWPADAAIPSTAADGRGKRFYRIERFASEARPLARLYVLETGGGTTIESVEPRERVLALVRHAYARRRLASTDTTASYFQQCAALADSVPIKRLQRPESIQELPRVIQTIAADLQ